MPGVIRVLTAKDVPGKRHGFHHHGLAGAGGGGRDHLLRRRRPGDGGRQTEAVAREAAEKVKVEYEVLHPVTDLFEALQAGSASGHTSRATCCTGAEIRIGDAEAAIARSAFVTRNRFVTQRVEHAYLEPEATLALPWEKDGNPGVKVYSCSQGVYEDRHQLAELLDLPRARVNVVQVQNGGGFGGKEDLTTQSHAALLAWLTRKPAMVHLTARIPCACTPSATRSSWTMRLAATKPGS